MLHQEDRMAMDVEVRSVEPQQVLSITRWVKVEGLDDHIIGSIRTLNELAAAQGTQNAGPPFGIYHGHVNENEDGPVEVCLPVRALVAVQDGIMAKQFPAAQMAYVDIVGDQCQFPTILQAYDAVYDWIKTNGYKHDGSPLEIWLDNKGEHMQIAWPFRD